MAGYFIIQEEQQKRGQPKKQYWHFLFSPIRSRLPMHKVQRLHRGESAVMLLQAHQKHFCTGFSKDLKKAVISFTRTDCSILPLSQCEFLYRQGRSFSAASSPVTLSPSTSTSDEASDLDLESDQGDDIALTSPDRLTSDVRHHFHGDLQ